MMAEMEERHEGGKPPGVMSGFYDLDAMTDGYQRGDLIITAGRPSMGKTALLIQVLLNIAVQGLPVVLFSMEMGRKKIGYRLLSYLTSQTSSTLKNGRFAINSWQPIHEGLAQLSGLPFYLVDSPSPSVAEMRSAVRQLHARHGQLGMVGIDYLQLMGGGENRVQELARITRGLKALARETDTPVNVLSQLSRGVEARTNKRPMMSDLRDSGAIEQDGDVIQMLYREEYYDPDTADKGLAEVIVVKNRDGETGTVKLLFEPQYTRFRNLAKGGAT